jgi:hypothetical protein
VQCVDLSCILQQGFRDGFPGFILAGLYSFYAYLKYLKLWEMERSQGTDGTPAVSLSSNENEPPELVVGNLYTAR